MTRAEADRWAAGSVITDDVFHATTPAAAEAIAGEGFRVTMDPRAQKWGRAWGDGVYVAVDESSVNLYAKRIGTSTTEKLTARVNVINPYIVEAEGDASLLTTLRATDRDFYAEVTARADANIEADDLLRDEIEARLVAEGMPQPRSQDWRDLYAADPTAAAAWGSRLRAELAAAGYAGGAGNSTVYATAFTDLLRERGYDAVIVQQRRVTVAVGGRQVVVFDPRNVTIVTDG